MVRLVEEENLAGAGPLADVSGEPVDQDYGSRDFSVTDPQGNVWALGTYRGAAAAS